MAISSRFFSPSTFAQEAEGLPCFPWDRVGQCHRKDPKCPCFSGTRPEGCLEEVLPGDRQTASKSSFFSLTFKTSPGSFILSSVLNWPLQTCSCFQNLLVHPYLHLCTNSSLWWACCSFAFGSQVNFYSSFNTQAQVHAHLSSAYLTFSSRQAPMFNLII